MRGIFLIISIFFILFYFHSRSIGHKNLLINNASISGDDPKIDSIAKKMWNLTVGGNQKNDTISFAYIIYYPPSSLPRAKQRHRKDTVISYCKRSPGIINKFAKMLSKDKYVKTELETMRADFINCYIASRCGPHVSKRVKFLIP